MYLKYYKKKKPPISSQLIIISIFASILDYYTYECIKNTPPHQLKQSLIVSHQKMD